MREIKFQAWDLDAEQMYNWESIRQHFHEHLDHPRVKVRQYTGLKDINGREIYEEDITRDDDGFLWKIYWEDGSFWAKGGEFNLREQLIELAPDFCEIIGDVYRNPELLEAAE
ncbi:YopX family protein [Bacillus licheniformis]|uniref:YopX family protein n=1 Tax=Bacillus licheniformis TaxID=1402 RepID=UPI00018C7F89|nr:YopX family protein [Bacillus licheniformis]MCY7739281.1 YopX family protein [Bacillus licheniformis]MDH3162281.1 YopX family protein [Bacillus licheniformis]QDL76968.1 hypothetical protein D9Y32_05620 [Bacillus licheniformis]